MGDHNNLAYPFAAHQVYEFQKLVYMPTVQENRGLVKDHGWKSICPVSAKTKSKKPVNRTAQDKIKNGTFTPAQ